MFSVKKPSAFNTVTFRLTAWHFLLFTLVSGAVMWFARVRLDDILQARTDHDLKEDLVELHADFTAGGVARLQEDFDRESGSNGPEAIVLALVGSGGGVKASSDLEPWKGLLLPPRETEHLAAGDYAFSTFQHPGEAQTVRMASLRLSDGSLLCLGHTLREEEEMMEIFHGVLLLAFLGMLTAGCVMAWWLTRTAMAGVARVTSMASTMGRERLGERVEIGHEGQEISNLAVAFNGMLERIDVLVRSLSEVTDHLAHDLRSPLTRLRGTAETALTSDAGLAEFKELAATVVEESDALVAMLNTMLEIARTDAGRVSLETTMVDVGELLAGSYELFRPAAEDRGLRLVLQLPNVSPAARSDRPRLQRIIANLIDNAIKYTLAGGTVTLSAVHGTNGINISVSDTGIGIGEADLARIFDRFYRADVSRSQPGSGLGLSLSRVFARALGGDITVSSTLGKGSIFTVRLPAAAGGGES